MKRFKIGFLSLIACLLLVSSCKTNDPAGNYTEWKNANDTYFAAMKDSTGYTKFTIPESRGGGSYYYKVVAKGDSLSASPLYNDEVTVQYRGRLINGSIFDQSYTGTIPPDTTYRAINFITHGVVPGWVENLQQMKVGEYRKIVLPQELGYGPAGAYPAILPYSVTVWDVRLVKVN
ncbi:MAG: FKBP-type peptidyl-prolyl cis-trans isomerase [Paludibacter sp.]|nr:FKBP-type peptidyl-prolyl cis-trans isomerase [Paludibacter sp.]